MLCADEAPRIRYNLSSELSLLFSISALLALFGGTLASCHAYTALPCLAIWPSPSAAGARKRPLVPNLAELLEEGEEGEEGGAAASELAGRRSDGAALLRERQSVGSGSAADVATGSPPHKFQRRGECQALSWAPSLSSPSGSSAAHMVPSQRPCCFGFSETVTTP